MSPDSIESNVIAELRRIERRGERIPNRYSAWTNTILKGLGRLGRNLRFRVYTSRGNPRNDPDVGEWLYDLMWLRYDRQGYPQSIPLVLESELGADRRDRVDDFYKLLVARADHRIMIFCAANKSRAESIVDELVDELEHSGLSRRGDRYLLAGLLESDGTFLCTLQSVRSGAPGGRSTRSPSRIPR